MFDISEDQFIALLERRTVGSVEVIPARDAWYVRINGAQWLRSSRECPYPFDRLGRTLHYLQDLGCTRAIVDLSSWPKSPDE